ncbi:MAG: flavoredoxin [Clostridium sp.]|nr:flavoredoxin [Clostridium sp.]
MKKEIEVFNYANEIMKAVKTGVLLTTKVDDKVNSMTISWGTLGIEWSKPIFTVFVRENRFTKHQLEKNPEFTINIPYGAFDKKSVGLYTNKNKMSVKLQKKTRTYFTHRMLIAYFMVQTRIFILLIMERLLVRIS